jgi:hypothetical protein
MFVAGHGVKDGERRGSAPCIPNHQIAQITEASIRICIHPTTHTPDIPAARLKTVPSFQKNTSHASPSKKEIKPYAAFF